MATERDEEAVGVGMGMKVGGGVLTCLVQVQVM